MGNVTFRPYRPADDEPALAALMRGLDADAANIRRTPEEHLARTLTFLRTAGQDRALCALAEADDGALIGYALLIPFWSGEYGGELFLLDEFYLTPDRRSQGLGARFIAWIEETARRTGRVGITFGVVGGNPRAMRFYERLGYERLDLVTFDKLLR
ncbi:MAG TPA: GNAT family N-acetyltransferase [Candidatus Nanopelagicales bacterium]|nr:GNAT family N-acetyltransferase [Candidatus Nanopelagicales bacterium]